MNKEGNVPIISTTELQEKLQNLDDHTILTIILVSKEGDQKDAPKKSV